MKIGIAFTMKNLLEYTKAAYESINTKHPYITILVSDWSTDETNNWINDLVQKSPATVKGFIEPLTASLAGKWNIAANTAWEEGCEAALICNNDIIFSPSTIDVLIERLAAGDVGLVTAHNVRGQVQPSEIHEVISPAESSEAEHPDFSCFLLAKTTWDTVGPFDERFIPCFFEDNDYHYRMQKAGIKAITTTAAPYYHYGSTTQNSIPGGICPAPQFEKLHAYFVSKHGVDPATYKPIEAVK